MPSIPSARKSKRGRPRVDATPVNTRFPPDELANLDGWIKAQVKPKPSRPEAIRRLVELGLDQSKPLGRTSQKIAQQASALAEREVDRMVDTAAPPKEQAKRKSRLLKGPREFRDIRKDHPKG
jgi:hypothetical protein